MIKVLRKIWKLWYGKVVIVGTGLSFITPWLFTRPALWSFFDFTGKGEIGDVIGGVMGTAIGLITAFLTFLAFWIQKKANEQQVDRFNKTQQKIEDDKKNEAKNRVELMLFDVESMLESLEGEVGWISILKKYKEELDRGIYNGQFLLDVPSINYLERIKNTPRMDLFVALIRMEYESPSSLILSFYSVVDNLESRISAILEGVDSFMVSVRKIEDKRESGMENQSADMMKQLVFVQKTKEMIQLKNNHSIFILNNINKLEGQLVALKSLEEEIKPKIRGLVY